MSKMAYTENNSVKECWKASMFKNLFSERTALLGDKPFPAVHKGLKFFDPTIKFANGSYSFKTSDVCDNVTWKSGNREFNAQYKKTTKKFTVSTHQEIADGMTGFIKYETTDDASAPHYVVGCGLTTPIQGFSGNAKFNPFTQIFKASCNYNADKFLDGVKVGADLKAHVPMKANLNPEFNLGVVYKNPTTGTTGVAFNHHGHLTLNHVIAVDKSLTAGLEFVQPINKNAPVANNLAAAVSYKIDGDHQVSARVNKKGELNIGLKKKFSSALSLQMATVVDATQPDSLLKAPTFGFKLAAQL